jgi:hypothetical protein
MLQSVSTSQNLLHLFIQDTDQFSWYKDGKIYDPCVLLNIKMPSMPQSDVVDQNERTRLQNVIRESVYLSKRFSYSRYTNINNLVFTDEAFHMHPQLDWLKQNKHTAVFDGLSEDFYREDGTERPLVYPILYFYSPNRTIHLPFNSQGLDYMTFAAMFNPFLINTSSLA